jgi:hypothetical protein
MNASQAKLKLIDNAQTAKTASSHATHAVAVRTNYPASTAHLSILQKIRILNTPPSPQLFGTHPLAERALDFRLQYLAAVAMLIALEREPTPAEQQSFIDLGTALGVGMPDAQEQLSERASLSVDDMAVLLDAVRGAAHAAWPYLLDVAWIHAANGDFDANELAATQEISTLLTTHLDATRMTGRFLPQVFDLEPLRPYLPALLASFFPFSNLVDHRWLDHSNGFVTDCTSGVMWPRFFVGQRWEKGDIVGTARAYDVNAADLVWDRELNNINFNFQLDGHGDWRFFKFETEFNKLLTFHSGWGEHLGNEKNFRTNANRGDHNFCNFIIATSGFNLSPSTTKFNLYIDINEEFRLINVGSHSPDKKTYLILCRDALPAVPTSSVQ